GHAETQGILAVRRIVRLICESCAGGRGRPNHGVELFTLLAKYKRVLRFVPVEKCPSEGGRPLELKVGYEASLDLQRLFGLDLDQNDGARLVYWNEKCFAHGEIVAGINDRC